MKIEDFEKDLKKSEKKIEYNFFYNVKTFAKRTKYRVIHYKKATIPFVTATLLSLPIYKALGMGYPIINDYEKIYNYEITNLETGEETNDFVDVKYKSFIKYTTPYVEGGDGIFIRYTIYYELDDINNFKSLEDLKEIKKVAHYETNVSKDNQDKFEILYYDINEDQYKLVREKDTKNQSISMIYVTLSLLSFIYFLDKSSVISRKSEDIDKLYPYIKKSDVKYLEKKLQMKNKNLQFLKGDSNENERSK